MSSVQSTLNPTLGICYLDETGKLHACEYHRKRFTCAAQTVADEMVLAKHGDNLRLVHNSESVAIAQSFASGFDPAGSWFLVEAQRKWLEERLTDFFSSTPARKVRLLEMGSAGYVHHYTFMSVVVTAMENVEWNGSLEVVVLDRCIFPLLQIDTIEKTSTNLKSVYEIEIGGEKFEIPPMTADIVDIVRSSCRKNVTTAVALLDAGDMDRVSQFGQFDLITEHFMSSFTNLQELCEVRRAQKNVLVDGGLLLLATGLYEEKENYPAHQLLLRELGFTKVLPPVACWDPYDISREDWSQFAETRKPVPTMLENRLCAYKSVTPGV